LRRIGGDRGRGALDQEQADARFGIVGPLQARRHDEGVGLIAGRHHALAAAERVARGGRRRAGGHVVEPVARRALLLRQHQQGRSIGHLGQPAGLHLGRCRRQQGRGDQCGVGIGGIHQAAAQFLHHHHGLDGAKAHAAVGLGHGQARQAQLGEFAVHGPGGTAGLGQGMSPVEAEALVHPAGDGVAQRQLIVGEFEVHAVQLPRTTCATMLRWTSLLPP
jgi:hypothetical protein